MEKKVFRLNEICKIKSGKRIPKGMDYVTYQTSHPYIRARDIKSGNICTDDLIYIEDEVYKKIRKYIIEKGDIAITIVGASVGDTGYATETVDGYNLTENAVRLTNFTESVDSKYLHYILMQKHYYDYMQLIAGAAAQPKLGIYKIQKIRVVLPKVSIQKRIADILTTYDNLIENNNKRIKLLEQMAESLYKEWFVRFRFPGYEDTEFENVIPKGWDVKKVKNCVKRLPLNQLYKQSDLENEGTVIVIDQSSSDFLGFHNNEPSHYASIEKPIILFGDHSCKFVLMIRDFSLGENIVPFITACENELNNYYLYYAAHKLISTEEYKRHWGRLTAMKIFVPPYQLQKSFSDIVTLLIEEKQKLWNENQLLKKQRDMLLPRLMSGKLEV